jgi:hypothetical protein
MSPTARAAAAVVLAGVWINVMEFLRNQVLFLDRWEDLYASLGLTFPAEPVNAAAWVVWAFVFAALIFAVSRRFTLLWTTVLLWVAGFVLMWLVIGNLDVLPAGLLWFAVPWSVLEVFGAAVICVKLAPAPAAASAPTVR